MEESRNLSIKNWSEDDRPREKLLHKGKQTLSNAELMAILIGSGSRNESAVELCKRILLSCDNNLNSISKKNVQQLMLFKGIGEAKAVSIVAALELAHRLRQTSMPDFTKIASSDQVFQLMQPIIGHLSHEEFWVLLLNNNNKVVYKFQISKGGLTQTVVDIRLIFKTALEHLATSLIVVHNHPSGQLKPSVADIQITQKIREAGKLMDIQLLDHVIITEKGCYSFADANELHG